MKKLVLPFFLLGSLVMIYVMATTGATLKTPATPHGILDLEFAYNTEKVNTVINAWTPTPQESFGNIEAAKLNTWLDFIFLFFYAGFLFLASKKIAQTFKGPLIKAGNIIAKGALLAGFLDVLENTGMLISLNRQLSAGIAFCTTLFSVIKWGLAIIAVLYILTGLLVLGFRKFMN
jgi:hypothetical protein